jgi:hypothetical protein
VLVARQMVALEWNGACAPTAEKARGGPEPASQNRLGVAGGYHEPLDGQAPLPVAVQVRSIVPSDFFSMKKWLVDFEVASIL